ncbi:MAG: phage major capsid protein [Thermoanaerobaculia bacterium]
MAAVISTACNRVFTNRGKAAPNYYKSFLKELKTDSAQFISLDMAYFGEVPLKNPGEPIEYDNIQFGTPRTTEALSFGLGFRITREAMLAMQKKPYGEFSTAKMIAIQKLAAAMRDSAAHTKEAMAATVILLANSLTPTTKYNPVGRDGKSLASLTHQILKQPGTFWANLFTGESLSQDSLGKMVTAAMTIPSDEGFIRAYPKSFTLLVGPKLANRAWEVVNTKQQNDSNNNNESVLNQYKFNIKVLPYLGANFSGYALQADDHEMYYFAPVAEMLEDEEDWETKGWRYSIYYQFGLDYHSPYGFLFNPGA